MTQKSVLIVVLLCHVLLSAVGCYYLCEEGNRLPEGRGGELRGEGSYTRCVGCNEIIPK